MKQISGIFSNKLREMEWADIIFVPKNKFESKWQFQLEDLKLVKNLIF